MRWRYLLFTGLWTQLQNPCGSKCALLPSDSDFSQIAYGQKDMSICEKPNQRHNHQIWPPKRFLQLVLWCASLVWSSNLLSQEGASFSEELATKRIYSHLLIHDPYSAVLEARHFLNIFPHSKSLQQALIRALSEKGDEVEALMEWKKAVEHFQVPADDRTLLEVLAWGVLNKGEYSSQLLIRMNALIGACFTHDARAIPLLLRTLSDTNSLVRSVAVRLCANFGDTPLQDKLGHLLKEEKVWYVRLEVIHAIGALRMLDMRGELKALIAHPKTLAEEKAAAIVSLIGMYEDIDEVELKSLIKSDRAGLRELACQIIAHLNLREKVDKLFPLLQDTSSDVRIATLNCIGLMRLDTYKGASIFSLVEPLLQDPTPEVAITAAWVTMLQGHPAGEKMLEKWILDKNPDIRRTASAALAVTGECGVNLSLKMLQSQLDPYVQVNLALGLIGQRAKTKLACDTLYSIFLKEEDTLWMWDASANPLFRSLSPSRLRHVEQIPQYPLIVDQLVKLDLLSILSILRYPRAQEALRDFLQHQTWGSSGSAAAILLQEGDEKSLGIVRGLLEDPDEKIRVQAALILALLGGDPAAVSVLQEAYSKVEREIKVHILEALGHIGDPRSIPFLLDVLKEPFQVLRVVAASALIQCLYH